jgi:osmotically-inducible protein OsmY
VSGAVQSEPPQYVVARIRDALAHDERVAALDIGVRIVGDDVFVTGKVATPDRQATVERVVRELVPGAILHNQLTVLRPERPTDAEEVT